MSPQKLCGACVDGRTTAAKARICADFYLCDARFGAPVPTPGLAAIGLLPEEIGLTPDATLARLCARTPVGLTTLDPRRSEPWYLAWVSFLRSARRKLRLIALAGPESVIATETEILERRYAALKAAGWDPKRTPLPRDVLPVVT
jgi:hypothetical protein